MYFGFTYDASLYLKLVMVKLSMTFYINLIDKTCKLKLKFSFEKF